MSTSKCPGCGLAFLKGRRRDVLFPDGEVKRRRVCRTCNALPGLIPVRHTALCSTCAPGSEKNVATICGACSNDFAHKAVKAALAPFAERIRGLIFAYDKNDDPRAEGLRMALDILDTAARELAAGRRPSASAQERQDTEAPRR